MNKLFSLLFFVSLNLLFSQQQAANWYFGNGAGLNFDSNSGAVVPLTNGALGTVEGCTTISDPEGKLLFYTDGSTVYNANHVQMLNGNGLLGDESSTQSALVVPKPNVPDIYYIFSVASNQNSIGLHYSEVNMTLDGGLGGITAIKNQNLLQGCAEKVSAVVKDCESGIIWVIAFSNPKGDSTVNMNSFHAFQVNDTGVNPTAVVSTLNLRIRDSRGYLKISPDGKKLASANAEAGLFIADFDTQNGIVSNIEELTVKPKSSSKSYGVEFSPNSELLYVTASNDFFDQFDPTQNEIPENHNSVLIQYDLNAVDVSASQLILDNRQLYRGGLQLGPNGKIYRALSFTYDKGSTFLGVINNPNELGFGANYQHDAINLGGQRSRQGLPPFIQSFFTEKIDIIQDGTNTLNLALCEGDSYTLESEVIPGAIYTWTRNGVTLAETDFDLEITEDGDYRVSIAIIGDECSFLDGQAIVTYSDNPVAFNFSLTQCDNDANPDDGFTLFNLTEANEGLTGGIDNLSIQFYNSQIDAENDTNKIENTTSYNNNSNPETLYIRVTNETTECVDFSMLTLLNVSNTQIEDYIAPKVCDEINSADGLNTFNLDAISTEIRTLNNLTDATEITYFETLNDALLKKDELPTNYKNTTPYSQIIHARAEIGNACYSINNVTLTINRIPEFEEHTIVYYCLNYYPNLIELESNVIIETGTTYSYLWSTGQTTATIPINEVGTYTVTVSDDNGCTNTNTITVEPSNIATINAIETVDGTLNNTVTVSASGEGKYVYSLVNQDGGINYAFQDSPIFENVFPGIYTVIVKDIKNDCGSVQDTIAVIGFPKFFTPNGDGINDTWQVYGINEIYQPNTVIRIHDRYGKLLKEINPLGMGWNGLFNGQELPTSDYWFVATLQDGRIYKNHFSLKR